MNDRYILFGWYKAQGGFNDTVGTHNCFETINDFIRQTNLNFDKWQVYDTQRNEFFVRVNNLWNGPHALHILKD